MGRYRLKKIGGAGRSSESGEVGNSILVKEISKSHRLQHNYQVSLGQFRNARSSALAGHLLGYQRENQQTQT